MSDLILIIKIGIAGIFGIAFLFMLAYFITKAIMIAWLQTKIEYMEGGMNGEEKEKEV